MRKKSVNQQNLTRRLRWLFVAFALLSLPTGAWGQDEDYSKAIRTDEYGGVSITSDNAEDILGDGTMSYDAETNVLTLNGIDFSCSGDHDSQVWDSFITCADWNNDFNHIIVQLVGQNFLEVDDLGRFFDGAGITFITDEANPGSLRIQTPSGYNEAHLFVDYSDPITPTYNNGLILSKNGNIYTIQTPVSYNITVAGTAVTSTNASNVLNDDYSSVSYNASTNTLTLKGVHLDSATGNNNINATSALTIHLEGYSTVGTINVPNVTFTTNVSLPGRLRYTSISGNTAYENGLRSGTDSNNKNIIYSSRTNPYIIFATGYKVKDYDDTYYYWNDNGDIQGWSNEDYSAASLDVSSDLSVVGSQNNAKIDYFKVSTTSTSCYLYPASLDDMNLVKKVYFLFDWGTCANKNVKVQVRGMDSNYGNDGTYSEEVSLPSEGGLVEIPLTGTVNSYYFQIYFSSTTAGFSFIPISVGFQKTESYGLTVGGVEVTSNNASSITGTNITGTVSFDATENTLTLNGATITGSIVKTANEAGEQLIVNLVGKNTVNGQISFQSSDRTYPGDLSFTGSGSLNITSNDENGVIDGVSSVNTAEGLYIATDTPDPICYNGYYIAGISGSVMSLTVSTNVTYPVWVYNTSTTHYTQLTAAAPTFTTPSANVDENHDGSVSFSNNTLTLTNFLCKTTEDNDFVFFVGKSLKNLTVNLVGENNILYNGFHYVQLQETEEEPTLTYTTSSNGSLTFTGDPSYWANNVIVNYENGLGYYNFVISTDWPRLQIGGTFVRGTTSTVGDYSNVSFNDATNTLTLGGVTIGSQNSIVTDIDVYIKNLNVEISGTNTVYGRFFGFYEENGSKAGTITFKKKSGAETAELTVSGLGDGNGPVTEFASSIIGEGLYISGIDDEDEPVSTLSYQNGEYYSPTGNMAKTVTISENEPDTKLWIGETEVTSANAEDVFLDGKVSYDMTTQTLSLYGATIGEEIVSNVGTLTIDLTGTNSFISISATGNATTLAFTGNGTLSLENSDGVISGFSSVNFGDFILQSSIPGIHWSETHHTLCDSDDEIAGEVTITPFELTVGSVTVTAANAANITGDNTVSFDATTNTLTLNGATINGKIVSNINALTVHLVGQNTITPEENDSPFECHGTGSLTFDSSNSEAGELLMSGISEMGSIASGYNVTNEFVYYGENGIRWINEVYADEINIYYNVYYGITVNSTSVSKCNKDAVMDLSGGDVTYTPDDNTLHIPDNSSVSDYEIQSHLSALNVSINGECALKSIRFATNDEFPATSGTLTIIQDEENAGGLNSLTLSDNNGVIRGFSNVSIEEPLVLRSPATIAACAIASSAVISNFTEAYDISIAGATVTDSNKDNVLGDGTVSYDNTNHILTLNNASIIPETEMAGISYKGEDDLTINLKGTNTVKGIGGCLAIAYSGQLDTPPSLTFTKGDTQACSVQLEALGETTIDAFTINHDGLFMLEDSREENETLISTTTVTSTLFSGGTGTSGDPFLLKTKEDLRDFAKYINNMSISTGSSFQLYNDINCNGLTGYEAAGIYDNPFLGVFDGNEKTISNLTAQDGLFGYVDGATIKDLTLSGCTITGATGSNAAGIAIDAQNATTIENCSVVNSTIACKADAYNPTVGCIVASLSGGTITECTVDNVQIKAETTYNYGSSPQGKVGGIVGNASGGTISSCVVKNGSKITDYYADENAQLFAGAIVGDYYGTTFSANYYHFNVTVETLNGTNTSNKVTESGYTQRAVGGTTYNEQTEEDEENPDIFANNGAVLYTKKVTLPAAVAEGSVLGTDNTYYENASVTDGILVAPGQTASVRVLLESGYTIGSFTVTNATTSATITTASETLGDNTTQYTFEMPDAPVTVVLAIARPLDITYASGQTWASYYTTENLTVPEGLVAYIVTAVDKTNGTVTTSQVNYMPANQAVLLERPSTTTATSGFMTSTYTGTTTTVSGNLLLGSVDEVAFSSITEGTPYVLYNNVFKRVTSGNITARRAYLVITGASPARLTITTDGTGTAIETISVEETDGDWYAIDGRKLNGKPQRAGFYIKNGKKVYIK